MVQTIGRIWPVYFSLGTLLVPLAYNCNSATEAFMFMSGIVIDYPCVYV